MPFDLGKEIVRIGKFDITEVAINYKKILRTTEC
jgi:hypothetical protein